MANKKNSSKMIRTLLTILLTLGVVLFIAALSFSGALAISSSLFFCFSAVVLSAGVEGLVYEKNIQHSLKKIFKKGYFEQAVLESELKQLLKNKNADDIAFLHDYKNQLACIKYFKNKHKRHELKKAKKDLKKMQAYFKEYINNPKRKEVIYSSGLSQCITDTKRLEILNRIYWVQLYTRLSWIINIAAGLASALVGIGVVKSSLTVLLSLLPFVVPGLALSMTVYGLAILGALGYMFLIHNTLTDMIKNDTLRMWKNKIVDLLHARNESRVKHVLRVSGVLLLTGLIVGFGIFTTLATAGTWWYAAKLGANAIPFIKVAATWMRNITVPIMGITNLLFIINNSYDSVEDVSKISLRKVWNHTVKTVTCYYEQENLLQFINPFRATLLLISLPFKFVMFVGHLVSMGMMGDKLGNIPEAVTAGVNAVSEGLTDTHYLLPESSGHHHHHHHHHTDIPTFILNVLLSPLYLVSAVWDSAFSLFNLKQPQVTFSQALKKLSDGLEEKPSSDHEEGEKPSASYAWELYQQYEKTMSDKKINNKSVATFSEPDLEWINEQKKNQAAGSRFFKRSAEDKKIEEKIKMRFTMR